MNTSNLQILIAVVTVICTVIMVVLAWVMLYRVNKTEVTFTGTPVDKKEFERHVEDNDREFSNVFAKVGGAERGVEKRLLERIKEVDHEGNESRRALHAEVKGVSIQVAKLEADNATQTTALLRLASSVEKINDKMK